ncbi:hypothetical protein PFBG_04238 [Plasmodium falciparum 7G8]|uniref:Uncharacterized protein n=1 Tax=Plasmodium falciparum (isolate 7G8) TaxID=57266 RepID=W7F881_PLAF8|nr:hypothetical protein PFBG_04238 [Plasmodium falciparum 7G8]
MLGEAQNEYFLIGGNNLLNLFVFEHTSLYIIHVLYFLFYLSYVVVFPGIYALKWYLLYDNVLLFVY